MAQNPYPNLGWNPVPGQPVEVEKLRTQLVRSATALQTAYQKIDRLLGESSFWEGDAAVGFREALDGDLPKYMKDAHTSLTQAAGHLGTWHGGLTGRRELAQKYDVQAGENKGDLKSANSRHETAKRDPDLKLAGQTFQEGAELQAAQTRLNAATARLDDAVSAVNKAQGALDDVLRKARELESTHEAEARALAGRLKDATKDLAPEEPGWLSKALSWIGDNLTNILSVLAAVAGLLALLLTGPVGIAFLLAAGALSLATLASRLADPKVRASIADGFTKGEFDSDFWENSVGLAGDLLGAVPGVGAAARGMNGAIQSTRFASEAVSVGQFLGRFGDDTVTAAARLMPSATDAGPIGNLIVRGVGGGEGLTKALAYASPVAGVGTAGFGLAAAQIDALQPGKDGATGVDGGRAGLFDGPGAIAPIQATLRAIMR
ncbi:integral membrane protein [Streptomyces zinciresistens K42]|uniref:Integral membrane protein n=1 Tax=Streptomyces zinciresistens K42 TaxID=700597 RepID=G2GNG5_9ACTN|nr:hypothetical protein [Streptomyces zinciresistens]EGX54948.1 integral membrane protein [Streptomyces zinciresistens K42]